MAFAETFPAALIVSNQIFAAVKDFRIDHPLDPPTSTLPTLP
jgi:hypothetical protein